MRHACRTEHSNGPPSLLPLDVGAWPRPGEQLRGRTIHQGASQAVPPRRFGGSRGLRALLETCACHYKRLGKPFVLVLDGLDHVWRINAEDKRPLDDLFSQVIPCPDNMVLLVGTQPVDDVQLPTDLLASAPKAEWRTLSTMSENAVLSYLRKATRTARVLALKAGRCGRSTCGRCVHGTGAAASMTSAKQ